MDGLTAWQARTLNAIAGIWITFQVFILLFPQTPLVERPVHLACALLALIVSRPLEWPGRAKAAATSLNALLAVSTLTILGYYLRHGTRLSERMEGIDDVLWIDRVVGALLLILLLEGVRRLIGWTLLNVLFLFIAFAFIGQWFHGWSQIQWLPELFRYDGMTYDEFVESLTMTANGLMGITTATSVTLVFYFVLFGAFYSAIGGGKLFIDIGLKIAGKQPGGAAKAAVVSSSLMGSISGSAVANVATTGIFTIPLMRKTQYAPHQAAAIESIASTGGQLMPPIMGIAAFVMAELLQRPYKEIVIAGLMPALAFYFSLFLMVDLSARRRGKTTLEPAKNSEARLWTRAHLFLPPAVLVSLLVAGWSAPLAALSGCAACLVTSYLSRKTWLTLSCWFTAAREAVIQAASVAIPIAAIGLIIEISIQSNLALKFSSNLIAMSGGNLLAALALIVFGCLIMGMGLPTVAAYIIGSILFVPTLLDLGVPELAAHFFVMYYCVLSMVTPPVALAAYAAAGLAQASPMRTSLHAFQLSWVAFLIPLAFVLEPAFLGMGSVPRTLGVTLIFGIAIIGWVTALEGHLRRPISWPLRVPLGLASLAIFLSPTLKLGLRLAGATAMAILLVLLLHGTLRRRVPQSQQ